MVVSISGLILTQGACKDYVPVPVLIGEEMKICYKNHLQHYCSTTSGAKQGYPYSIFYIYYPYSMFR